MRILTYFVVALAGLIVLPWDVAIVPGPMIRDVSKTDADEPQDTPTFKREVVYFPCSGVRCQAWLYMPKHPDSPKPPIVVAAHGLGGQKDFGLQAYGERFAAEGLASLIFDYRTFGGSEGEPRHWVSPSRHLQDWQDAVDYVRGSLASRVDAQRLMLWGTSFAGGHVLTTAAKLRENVTAVVAQVPFTDGKAAFRRNVAERGPLMMARAVFGALHDAMRSFTSYPPAYFPIVGKPGQAVFMMLDDAEMEAYYAKHPKKTQGGWRNMGRCLLALEISRYRPIQRVPEITAPVMYVAASRDALCPLEGVRAALDATRDGRLVVADTTHFSVYSGKPLEELSAKQAEFFRESAGLPARRPAAAAAEAAAAGGAQPAPAPAPAAA